MGGLAHYLEQEGLATTQISLIREHTEKIRPPRALWVPFELGRPLGPPDDPPFQQKVLRAALDLLEEPAGPVLKDFPEEEPGGADLTGWACPVEWGPAGGAQAAGTDPGAALEREMEILRPWYDRSVQRRGRTTVGVSGIPVEEAARLLAAFLQDPAMESPRPDLSAPEAVKLAAEDVKAYYLEAASAQPGKKSSAQMADWFWGETAAGGLILSLRSLCLKSEDPMVKLLGTLLLVPRAQEHRAV